MRLLPIAAALTVSCATGPAPLPVPAPRVVDPGGAARPASDPSASARERVAGLRREVASQIQAQAELYWRMWIGGEAADFAASHAALATLATREWLDEVERLRARAADAREARALGRLRNHLATEYVAARAAEPSREAAAAAVAATLTVDGRQFLYRDLESLLADEAHAGQRAGLAAAAGRVDRSLRPLFESRRRALEAAAREVGFDGTMGLALALREAEAPSLASLAEEVLAGTEAPYLAAMAQVARRELRLPLDRVRRADVPRLLRSGEVDGFFPAEAMKEGLFACLARAGLEPSEAPGLSVDFEARPRKSPRALAVPVRVPGDVRLSVRPAAGLGPFSQALFEAGQAVALAHSLQPDLLGSGAVAGVWGHLFEELLGRPGFVALLGVPEGKRTSHARASALRRAFRLRRDAGRVLFELAWAALPQTDPVPLFAAQMARAWGLTVGPDDVERFVSDHDGFLLAADRLRSQVMAAQLDAALQRAFGAEWWRDGSAGERLRGLMAQGSEPSVEEWLAGAGAGGLDPEPLLAALRRDLVAR